MIKSVGVFAGSSTGARPAYREAARNLGLELAARNQTLVYGGAHVGLMGALADAALEAGGEVIGVIPRHLADMEVAHTGLPELRLVDTMLERKQVMAEASDAFIALPGGLGTLDELFEMLTWTQLELQHKPCGLLDVEQYFSGLIRFLRHAADERFLHETHYAMITVENDARRLLRRLELIEVPRLGKWIDR